MTTHVANNSDQENPDKRHGLFRKQAVEKQQDRLLGDVLVVPPISYSIVTAIIILFIVTAIILLVNGTYARKETVQGTLVPDTGVIKVYASTNGIVKDLLIHNGDTVIKGQPLMVVNGDHILESGERLESLLLLEYQIQQEILTSQLNRLPKHTASKKLELKQKIDTTWTDILHLEKQKSFVEKQMALVETQLKSVNNLYVMNLATQSELDTLDEKWLILKAQDQEFQRNLDGRSHSLKSLKLQSSQLIFEQLNQQDQLNNSLSTNAQSIAQLHGQRSYVIKANKAGTVSNIQINEGQETQTNKPLLTIMPTGSQLEAELLIPARAIGFVEPGQTVKLRYSAFNYQKFGLYEAEISEVSNTVLLPNELHDISIGAQEPMYRITAKLNNQNVEAYGKPLPLKEGISLEADIKLAERSLIEWLLEPLFSLKGRL